jgi:tetratricopeptide (TPR) repeat protein
MEAAQHAQTALKLEPRSSEDWNALGFYYGLSGNYTKALDFFLSAYTIDPSSRVAAYNISGTYAKLGKTEAALEYLEHALKSRRLLSVTEKDNDFNSLRDLPRYKKLLAEAKQRFDIK